MSTPSTRWTIAGALAGSAAALLAAAAPASAHTGAAAGGLGDGLLHPLLGPDHLLAMLAVGVVAALVASRRVAWLVPAAFVAGMVVGGAAGLAGITFPGLELAVAGTLVVLGLLVTGRVQVAESWVPAVALLFGTAHGLAHGGELPSTAAPLAYMVGFVVATVGLHVAGVAGGTALRARPGARAAIGSGLAVTGVGLVLLA